MSLRGDVIVMDNGSAARRVREITRPTPICVSGGDLHRSPSGRRRTLKKICGVFRLASMRARPVAAIT